ncbi:hypothetical protein [Microvirga solisilvae]|uniref:hypothetical protein n=1 Tax=Microvirga solisilvae TaxID=2919498 RepID=UPI001FAEFAEB|nr:hypothetical protein [Microvirga solisilvae]
MNGYFPFQEVRFSDIKHKLPKESWAYSRNERNAGEFENERVLYHAGDLHLKNLNLDIPLAFEASSSDEDGSDFIFLILVDGHLRVDHHISNHDTDGATELYVLGDLQARNMVVGGQTIYVTGALRVEELFWGDYNHGDLVVMEGTSAQVLMDTDGYVVKLNGEAEVRQRLSQWDAHGRWQSLDLTTLNELFPANCVIEVDDSPTLNRTRVLELLEAGQSVILRNG